MVEISAAVVAVVYIVFIWYKKFVKDDGDSFCEGVSFYWILNRFIILHIGEKEEYH